MSKSKPLVTVLITTYNRPEFLSKCLDSVISQDFKDYEVIIIDDCSTIKADTTINKYQTIPNLHYIKNKQNLGYPKCLNKGISLAKGTYLAILDDDDQWIDPTKLSQQVNFLETHPNYAIVGTGAVIMDEKAVEIARYLMLESDEQIRAKILETNCFIHSSLMYRKPWVVQVGGYSEKVGHDAYPLSLKLGTHGKLANLQTYSVGYTYRKLGVKTLFKTRLISKIEFLKIIGEYKNFYPNYKRALFFRYREIVVLIISLIFDIPPFVQVKQFVKAMIRI